MQILQLPLHDAVAGERLAAPVFDCVGNVLMPAGATLTDAAINGLARRGVATVSVARAPLGEAVAASRRRQEIEQRVETRFRRAGQGQASRLLRQATLEFLLDKPA